MTASPLADLTDLLAEQRAALRTGELADLADLTARIEESLRSIDTDAELPDGAGLDAVKATAKRNLDLLIAARNGVQAVRRRMAEVRDLSDGLQTYGCDGKRRALRGGTPQQDRSF